MTYSHIEMFHFDASLAMLKDHILKMIFDGYTAQAATAEAYNLGNRRACFSTVLASLCDARNPSDLSRCI